MRTRAEIVYDKWSNSRKRNSSLAWEDVAALEPEYNTDGCVEALIDYRDIHREDYSDYEDYKDARDEAWEQFLCELETIERR